MFVVHFLCPKLPGVLFVVMFCIVQHNLLSATGCNGLSYICWYIFEILHAVVGQVYIHFYDWSLYSAAVQFLTGYTASL